MKVSENCFAVTGLGYSPPFYVNAGLVTGEQTTLIVDAGGNAAAAATIHGYASIAKPANHLLVINTEKHFDHVGGNSFFRDRNIDIWGHIDNRRNPAEFQAEIAEFNSSIPNRIRRESLEANAFFEGTRQTNPNRAVQSDLQWDLGNLPVHILLTPGHTPTNLSIWIPSERVLYTGDCLIRSYLPNLEAGGPDDWQRWLKSLEKLENLSAQTVVCGHGPVFREADVPRTIDQVRRVLIEAIKRGHAPTV